MPARHDDRICRARAASSSRATPGCRRRRSRRRRESARGSRTSRGRRRRAPEAGVVRDAADEMPDVAGAEDVDRRRRLDRLDEDLHLSAADEPRLCREVVGQLVAHGARLARLQRLARLPQRLVLVAAAADGADDAAVGVDEHLGADALGRGAVGRHDGDERHFLAVLERLAERREDFVVHGELYGWGAGCRSARVRGLQGAVRAGRPRRHGAVLTRQLPMAARPAGRSDGRPRPGVSSCVPSAHVIVQ